MDQSLHHQLALADLENARFPYQNGTLFYHVGTTLWETLLGFFIAVVAGYTIALLLWWSEVFRKISEPYLVVLNALPKIALGPLIIIWCGTAVRQSFL